MAFIRPVLNDVDRLALSDIAWFLKGYLIGHPDEDLGEAHISVIRKAVEVARWDSSETKKKETP